MSDTYNDIRRFILFESYLFKQEESSQNILLVPIPRINDYEIFIMNLTS